MWKFLLCIFMIPIKNGAVAGDCVGCDDDKLISYLANLEVLSPENIFSLSFDDLERLCKKLDEHLKPIQLYMQSCAKPSGKDLYVSLIKGVQTLNDKLCCMDTNFFRREVVILDNIKLLIEFNEPKVLILIDQSEFSIYHACLAELKNDFDSCQGPADWNEEQDEEKVCRTYKSIVDCYYVKTAKVCGKDAAKYITEVIEAVINSVIGTTCTGINSMPDVKDIMPDRYIRKNGAEKESFGTCITTIIAEIVFIQYVLA